MSKKNGKIGNRTGQMLNRKCLMGDMKELILQLFLCLTQKSILLLSLSFFNKPYLVWLPVYLPAVKEVGPGVQVCEQVLSYLVRLPVQLAAVEEVGPDAQVCEQILQPLLPAVALAVPLTDVLVEEELPALPTSRDVIKTALPTSWDVIAAALLTKMDIYATTVKVLYPI